MAKKDKKEMVEEVEEEVLEEEPVPEPVQQGRIEVKRIEGIGYTKILYDNGETEKLWN